MRKDIKIMLCLVLLGTLISLAFLHKLEVDRNPPVMLPANAPIESNGHLYDRVYSDIVVHSANCQHKSHK